MGTLLRVMRGEKARQTQIAQMAQMTAEWEGWDGVSTLAVSLPPGQGGGEPVRGSEYPHGGDTTPPLPFILHSAF